MEEDSYLTDTESNKDEHTWDDVDEVSFSYIKMGNSTLDWMGCSQLMTFISRFNIASSSIFLNCCFS